MLGIDVRRLALLELPGFELPRFPLEQEGWLQVSADSLYDDIRQYLRVSLRVTRKTGDDINVGERFATRITVTNTAYAANKVGQPRIVFDKPRVYVESSQYTSVVGGNRWINMPDQELWPGESTSSNVEFEATSEIGGWLADLFSSEKIAKVWVLADLDQNRFFEIWNYEEASHEIEPT